MLGPLFQSMNYISIVKAVGLTAVISSLTACYVMPVQPHQNSPQYTVAPVVIKPVEKEPVQFPARLYPANAKAAKHGQVVGWVSNNLEGRGKFMMTISGEVFEGEATRQNNRTQTGIASGSGSKGSFLNCTYQMNSTSMGSGQCQLSDGSEFTMHF